MRRNRWLLIIIVILILILPPIFLVSKQLFFSPTPTRTPTPTVRPITSEMLTDAGTSTPSATQIQLTSTPRLLVTRTPRPSLTPSIFPTLLSRPVVTKLEDSDDGVCNVTDCSLREAISNAAPGATIEFNVTGTVMSSKPLEISNNLTINGPASSPSSLTITAVFLVKANGVLNINNLSIANVEAVSAISNNGGTLAITNSTFYGNSATTGGSLVNQGGIVTINNSTFHDNRATTGGAILNVGGTLTITNSTFYDNKATDGSAIRNIEGAVTLTNSTFQGNSPTAVSNGLSGTLLVINCTFHDNSVGGAGSIFSLSVQTKQSAVTTLRNTIIDGSSGDVTCEGIFIDGGNNLQYNKNRPSDRSCGTSIQIGDPKLAPLQDNGGPTYTMALLPGSAAINAGNPNICPPKDQRGGVRSVDSKCDIGAFQQGGTVPMK